MIAYPPSSLPPADLYQPMEDTVVPLLFNSYLYLPKDPFIRRGFMEILPQIYSNTKSGSHLHLTTLAVAFFSVAAWTGQGLFLWASERYFTEALPKIRQALQRDEDSELDEILISILLLSTYEVSLSQMPGIHDLTRCIKEFVAVKDCEHPLKAHLKGAVALINSRRSRRLPTPLSSIIDHAVEGQIIRTTRGLTAPMVPTPNVWPLSQTEALSSPSPLLASAASELVNLRQAWETMMAQPPDENTAAVTLNKAKDIDTDLMTWAYAVPQYWVPVAASMIPQSVRDAGIYRHRCDCYTDMWIATTWNTYRECRLLIQNIILSCLRILMSEDPDGSKAAAVSLAARRIVDDICATVPFFLGDQMESVRMKPGLVQYPSTETRPVTMTHRQSAPLMGAWMILPCLKNLHFSDLALPQEQSDWVQQQMNRTLVIYFQR
ncbi:hypothetical protein NUU61_000596 [Penicillium alfredii]|uniref:Uncharacterized protein n=1 Tax=Penicillium alfredii TaxID=1506179 RepID=A0A9W9GA89_9EURO|nr:uncharacterized protein NUU61_000596 [Penicillium alfredii]KAJ5114837.1 hypothetical protein NUU61_000596 [Penicillium alfredii]